MGASYLFALWSTLADTHLGHITRVNSQMTLRKCSFGSLFFFTYYLLESISWVNTPMSRSSLIFPRLTISSTSLSV
ncbi:MAG: hypothetical protein COV10_00765 [Candidatus Vogelbacteria bacterium CG10_big_fil_rev_8_21_14_0_10_51_16]|uniref:Uncharacterized protein n=1 Tax=Candidatus Vogelbacteria bacterium CG10_big_fil_rev_8_21_14_0_10_51_16 TaxID=1975045 RepID=A0A2H0RFB0_9BACT|nr:MAG: hypothetical protein COV10_00765 [Candidatus Vogelbacteria bacterium CG10_big_fil_rev_8_21_14_0_10_51_16]